MNTIDASWHTVHEYPGGSEALAPRLGMSAAVLRNKVNPNNTTHHLTLAEAIRLQGISGDHRIAHAMAGALVYTLAPVEGPDAGTLITALLTAAAGQGDLAKVVSEALDDGRITPNEAGAIAKACATVQAATVTIARCAGVASNGVAA